MSEPVALSVTACCKLWWVTSGEFEMKPDAIHWGYLWEPLDVDASENAEPYCCLVDEISFTEPDRKTRYRTHHHNWGGCLFPNLVHVNNLWWEIGGGQVIYRNGRWHMRWSLRKNTRHAITANEAMVIFKQQ